MTSDNALSRPQVFGFLLGIDLKGMGAPGNENDEDQTRDMPPSSFAGGAQSDSKQAEQEEEEVNTCSAAFSIDLPTVCLNCRLLELFRLQAMEFLPVFYARLCLDLHRQPIYFSHHATFWYFSELSSIEVKEGKPLVSYALFVVGSVLALSPRRRRERARRRQWRERS